MESLLIRGAEIMDPSCGRDETADILISQNKIEAVGKNLSCETAREVDAAGLIAAPGLVDLHVHLRDPGFPKKEDLFSGCRAAAAGGVTSLMCMPNTSPVTDNPETVRYILSKAETADARVYVAAAITRGLHSAELCSLKLLKEAGAVALSDDGRPVVNTALMAQAMRKAPSLGLKVMAHCEDLYLSEGGKVNEGEISAALHVPGVPAAAEDCATAREIALAAAYNVPVHICHVSTKTAIALIRDAKRRGVPVTAETAPHYFCLTQEELRKKDADYRMSPPLRTETDRLAVVAGLADGTIDIIATDHAPHTPAEKSDFLGAPNGVIGMETSLAAGITFLVGQHHFSMMKLLDLMSTAPAKLLGIPAGTLAPGAAADLVLFDPAEEWVVYKNHLHGKSRNAVFKGRKLTGRVKMTVCGGRIVYHDENYGG